MDTFESYILYLKIETDGSEERICADSKRLPTGEFVFQKEDTRYIIFVKSDELMIESCGEIEYSLRLKKDLCAPVIIQTPYGEMFAKTNVKELQISDTPNLIRVDCEYRLLFADYEQKHMIRFSVRGKIGNK